MILLTNQSLYDVNLSFWENFKRGPRPLTPDEKSKINSLTEEIKKLENENGVDTRIKFIDKEVDSPIGLAAGPAYGSKWLDIFSNLGYDILTQKTVRHIFWQGYPPPNILSIEGDWENEFIVKSEFTGSITNSFGIGSLSSEEWMKDLEPFIKKLPRGKTLKISVVATPEKGDTDEDIINQFVLLSSLVKKIGSHGVELDLSCPNIHKTGGKSEGDIYQDSTFTRKISESIRAEVGNGFPILLKVGYLNDYKNLIEAVSGTVSGIVAINAMPATVKYEDGRNPFSERGGRGGVCGKVLFKMGLKSVKQLVELREKNNGNFTIIGVGGILDGDSALQYLNSGADAIEIATGAMFNPFLALEIKKAILEKKVRGK